MVQKKLFGLLFASLLLASCNQTALPAKTASAASETTNTVQADLAAFKLLQAQVSRGEQANPVDSEGQPIDLTALIAQIEADLAHPLSMPHEGTLSAQAVYAQRIYTDISADNNFMGNYSFNTRTFPRFNWSNDGCSVPYLPSRFRDMLVFKPACIQHDFGYRNARAYPNLMNENHRAWIDGQFKEHMRSICSRRTLVLRPGCYVDAEAFWGAVRNWGDDSFY